MVNFFLVCALAVSVFGMPLKGSFLLLTLAALLYVTSASGICLLMSAFIPSQIDRRHLPHFDRHDHSVRPFFRHDRPGVVAGGRRALRRNCAASGATLSAGAEPLPQDHQFNGLNRPRSGYENLAS
jgi:hypothetical protein